MAVFFTVGEQKKRPGLYQRYENIGGKSAAGATDGYAAIVFRGNWGPLGQVITFDKSGQETKMLGDGGENGTVDAITKLFEGGVNVVYAVRLGAEGTKGSVTLDGVNIIAKYEGSRALSVAIKSVLGDDGVKHLKVYDGTTLLETIEFAKTAGSLLEANSSFLDFVAGDGYDAAAEMASVDGAELTGGADPASITVTDYSNAFDLLERYEYNTITTDSESVEVHALLQAFIKRMYKDGKLCFGVVAEPVTVDYETRKTNAKAFNAENIIYVGDGFKAATGAEVQGYRAGALIAGIVASVSSDKSITHRTIDGAVELMEPKKNSEYEAAIDSGMIVFSLSPEGLVWIENGITTLVSPDEDQDDGWKKIKRTKIRFELMTRADKTVAPMIGKVKNNPDGRAEVIIAVNGLLEDMKNEEKLLDGAYCEIDPDNAPEGDSAWFNIYADDVDSLEKIYFVYKFRFSPNV